MAMASSVSVMCWRYSFKKEGILVQNTSVDDMRCDTANIFVGRDAI